MPPLQWFFVLCLLFLFVGCYAAADDDLNVLYQEGVLAMLDIEGVPEISRNTTQVIIGDLIQPRSEDIHVVFPRTYDIHVQPHGISAEIWNRTLFSGLNFSEGDRVQKGDLLAYLIVEPDPALLISLYELEFEIARFETAFERESRTRRQNRTQLGQIEYEQFLMRIERTRERYNERLENIKEQMTGRRFYAPFDGTIVWAAIVPPMSPVVDFPPGHGHRLVSIIDEDYFYFAISGGLDIFRMGQILEVYSTWFGPDFYFDVQIVSDPLVIGIPRLSGQTASFRLLPVDHNRMNELFEAFDINASFFHTSMTHVRFNVPLAENAMLVNRWAITFENNRNFVWLYENGEISRRFVEVGATFGEYTQILTGLYPGQEVVVQ